jgi:hypothetical protein
MTAIQVSICDAIRTGSFGQFTIGASRHVIGHMLGDVTDATLVGRRTSSCIWVYGTTEFHFANDVLTLIHCDNDDLFNGGPSLLIDPWKLRLHMPLTELKRILHGNDLSYTGCDDVSAPDCLVRLSSGFTIGFVLDENVGLGRPGLRSWSIQSVG